MSLLRGTDYQSLAARNHKPLASPNAHANSLGKLACRLHNPLRIIRSCVCVRYLLTLLWLRFIAPHCTLTCVACRHTRKVYCYLRLRPRGICRANSSVALSHNPFRINAFFASSYSRIRRSYIIWTPFPLPQVPPPFASVPHLLLLGACQHRPRSR